MSTINEKSAVAESELHKKSNIVIITRPLPTHQNSSVKDISTSTIIEDADSIHSSSPSHSTNREKLLDSRRPLFNQKESKQPLHTTHTSFEGDLEAQNFEIQQSQATVSQTGLLSNNKAGDPMWPNRQELKRRKKAIKRERACCACWAGLSKKQRSIISTLIILFVLGAGLGVGFGISKRVGGGVISSKGTNYPVLAR